MARADLMGKVALVTGGASGIGWETCRQLHERGASIVLVDLDQETASRAARRLVGRSMGFGADVTDLAAMQRVVDSVVEVFGAIDICVANAGIPSPVDTVRSVDPRAFDRVIEVNVLGVWRTVRAALPALVESRGQVVIVSSVYAFMPGMLAASYAASKAAAESLGRSLRIELAPYGVATTVAKFGFVRTATFEDALAAPRAAELENLFPRTMRGRLTPEQAAAAIVRGIDRRAPNVIAPSWWGGLSLLRGVTGPVGDAAFARDPRLRRIISEADRTIAGPRPRVEDQRRTGR